VTSLPPEAGADPQPPPRVRPYLHQPPPEPPATEPAGDETGSLRPFVLTSGRVQGVDPDIGLETQVSARTPVPPEPSVPLSGLAPELRAIVALCADPMSVAEISARLRLHLGVTRILVGDLRSAGHVTVHTMDVTDPHNPETIRRVIRGLRAIS
jgi:hypothetical protein